MTEDGGNPIELNTLGAFLRVASAILCLAMLACGDAERELSVHRKAAAFQAKVAEERAASAKLVFIAEVLDEDGEAVPSVRVSIGVRVPDCSGPFVDRLIEDTDNQGHVLAEAWLPREYAGSSACVEASTGPQEPAPDSWTPTPTPSLTIKEARIQGIDERPEPIVLEFGSERTE